jgi:hypothetical protein
MVNKSKSGHLWRGNHGKMIGQWESDGNMMGKVMGKVMGGKRRANDGSMMRTWGKILGTWWNNNGKNDGNMMGKWWDNDGKLREPWDMYEKQLWNNYWKWTSMGTLSIIYSHLEGLGHIQKAKKNCGPRKLHQRENHLHFATVNCLNSIQESQGIGDDGPLGMWSILIRAWESQSSAIQCPNWGIRVEMNDDSEVRISPSWGEESWCLGVAVQLSAAIERCSAVPCHRSCAAGLSAPQKNRASLHGQSRKKGLKSRFVSRRSTDFCLEKYGRMVNWQIQRSTELLVWYVLYS